MVIADIIWYSTWYINQNISFSKFQFIQRTFSCGNETIESKKKWILIKNKKMKKIIERVVMNMNMNMAWIKTIVSIC